MVGCIAQLLHTQTTTGFTKTLLYYTCYSGGCIAYAELKDSISTTVAANIRYSDIGVCKNGCFQVESCQKQIEDGQAICA